MRNILIILTLCALTLTTSNVFAERYNDSLRTERLGLSYYDGRPLYIAFLYGSPSILSPQDYRLEAHRVMTGENIEDFGSYNSGTGGVTAPNSGQYMVWGYYARGDDGQLTLLTTGRYNGYPLEGSDDWISEALRNFDPSVSSGDLGLNVADELFAMAKDIFGEFFPFFAGIFVLAAGSKYFEHLAKTGVKKSRQTPVVGSELKTKSREVDVLDYVDFPNDNPYRLRTPRELREERIRENREILSAQANMSEKDAVRAAYIDGSFWGREFSDDVKESNRQLLESFDAMDEFTRSLLIQRFEEMSFFQEASVLKSYRYDAYGVGEYSGANPFVNGSFDDNADDVFDSWSGAPWDDENSEV